MVVVLPHNQGKTNRAGHFSPKERSQASEMILIPIETFGLPLCLLLADDPDSFPVSTLFEPYVK